MYLVPENLRRFSGLVLDSCTIGVNLWPIMHMDDPTMSGSCGCCFFAQVDSILTSYFLG